MKNYSGRSDALLCCFNTPSFPSWLIAIISLTFLAGCSNTLKLDPFSGSTSSTVLNQKKGGGYYLDDGPGDNPPPNLASVPDAIPQIEPLRKSNMQPYVVLGKTYTPMTSLEPYKERGIASWYGRRYHGKKTASGEVYNMYEMTAAHTTLPIPSYVRVTNIKNKKSIVVRINDRGPFLSNRLIDLSYTSAYKLDVLSGGSAWVEVETIIPGNQVTQLPTEPPTLKSEGSLNSPDIPDASSSTNKIYLQLAAFSAYNNADTFLARMRIEFPDLSNLLGITVKNGLFKVHAGPYSNQLLARQAANKISQSLPMKPLFLVQ
jgi:rare lipoprotein A